MRRSLILVGVGIVLVFAGIIPISITLLRQKEIVEISRSQMYDLCNNTWQPIMSVWHAEGTLWSGILNSEETIEAKVEVHLIGQVGVMGGEEGYNDYWDASLYFKNGFGSKLSENNTVGAISNPPPIAELQVRMRVSESGNYSLWYEHDFWIQGARSGRSLSDEYGPIWPSLLEGKLSLYRPIDRYSVLVGAVFIIGGGVSLICAYAIRPTERPGRPVPSTEPSALM